MSISREQEQAVRDTLTDLLGWDELQRSPQLAKFLRYIVEAKLAGNEQNIKAYAVAVDVFGRAASFDPQNDPIVRVQARRLRALLDRYYAQANRPGALRIRLPVGRYVPEFEERPADPQGSAGDRAAELETSAEKGSSDPSAPAEIIPLLSNDASTDGRMAGAIVAVPSPPVDDVLPGEGQGAGSAASVSPTPMLARPPAVRRRRPVLQALLGLLIVAVLVTALAMERGWFGQHTVPTAVPPIAGGPPLPAMPVVFVGSFSNLTGVAGLDPAAAKLKQAIVSNLASYPELSVATEQDARPPATALVVTGLIRPTATGIEISALVAPGLGSPAAWSTTLDEPLSGSPPDPMILDIARTIVGRVAAFRGPLHVAGRAWLDQQTGLEASPSLYTCLLRFRLVGEHGQATDTAVALACFERLLKVDPHLAPALAGWAWLEASAALSQAAGSEDLQALLKPAADSANAAVALLPDSAFAHTQLARVLDAESLRTEAEAAFVRALDLNPADLDARAAYARTLGLGGNWALAVAEASEALGVTTTPPGWYHEIPMLDAYRRGDYAGAIGAALDCGPGADEVAAAVVVAAGARGHRPDIVDQFLSGVLQDEHFRAHGILSQLKLQLANPDLVAAIGDGLSLAGVTQAALLGPF